MVAPTTVAVKNLVGDMENFYVPGDAELGYPEGGLDTHRRGSTEPWVAQLVQALAVASHAKNLLETGSYEGETTALLYEILDPDALLHTVELDGNRAMAVQRRFNSDQVRVYIKDALAFIRDHTGPPFDFVFLDDSHDPMHLARELDALYDATRPEEAKVTRGAIICCHDVIGPCGLDAVVKARHGFVLDLPLLHIGGGLGIIQRPR